MLCTVSRFPPIYGCSQILLVAFNQCTYPIEHIQHILYIYIFLALTFSVFQLSLSWMGHSPHSAFLKHIPQQLTQFCFPAKFELSGPQSSAFLDRVVAGSVPKPGRTTLAHMLTTGGKVIIVVMVIMMLMMVMLMMVMRILSWKRS